MVRSEAAHGGLTHSLSGVPVSSPDRRRNPSPTMAVAFHDTFYPQPTFLFVKPQSSEPSFWRFANTFIAIALSLCAGYWPASMIIGGISAAKEKRSPAPVITVVAADSAATAAAQSAPLSAPVATAATASSPQAEAGKNTYMTVCIACHQATGLGLPAMFPPLAGSDWVSAPKPDRLIRIVLHGFMGPFKLNGQPFNSPAPMMPPQGAALNDQQIADVLTFVRSSWGNTGGPVSPAEVAAIRESEKAHLTMWNEAELLKIADR